MNENQLVPYYASPLPSGPYLVFAPHPDDETLGMGGTIILAAKSGIEVNIVFVTDGGKGGDPATRKKEAAAASEILGAKNIFHLNLPDREVGLTPFPEQTLLEIMEQVKPATVFLPSFQEIHPDHRATNHVVLSFFEHRIKHQQEYELGHEHKLMHGHGHEYKLGHDHEFGHDFQMWFYEINRQGEINRLIDISDAIEIKEQAIDCYASQLAQLDYKSQCLCLDYARSITLGDNISYAEGFWLCPKDVPVTLLSIWNSYHKEIYSYQCPASMSISACISSRVFSDIKHVQSCEFEQLCESDRPSESEQLSESGQNFHITDVQTLVSVIVRTKERLSLLEEALGSIAGQTWRYIEAVVVNDGSDDIDAVIQKFRQSIFRIVCVRTEEKNGRVAAANKGIETATGEWIMFLDDDDLLEPDACFNLLNKAVQTNASVVYGKVLRRHYLENGHVDIRKPEYVYGRVFDKDLIVMENYIPFNALLINRQLACQSYPLREDLTLFEDWDFLILLSRKVDFVYLPVQVAIYRCWESSTATGSRFSHEEIVKAEQLISQKWHQNITFKNILAFREYIVEQTQEATQKGLQEKAQEEMTLQLNFADTSFANTNQVHESCDNSFVEKLLLSAKRLKNLTSKKFKNRI
ncbi:MAG: glycosyltransferase [Desulfamplus sp.]|nr:glycosyltransferase [Desulfamplus sp.]